VGRMSLQSKELNKLMAVLSDDCLVQVYVHGTPELCSHQNFASLDTVRMNSRRARNDLSGNSTTMSTTSIFAMYSAECGSYSLFPRSRPSYAHSIHEGTG
jgi:hypothetical protein